MFYRVIVFFLAMVFVSCATVKQEERIEYWNLEKKAYFDYTKLLSEDPAVKKQAQEDYYLLLPESKERVQDYLAMTLRLDREPGQAKKVTAVLEELGAGARVVPSLVRACGENPAMCEISSEYISRVNPKDINRGAIGAFLYEGSKNAKVFAVSVLALTGKAAATALPDIFRLAAEKGLSYEDYSRVMDAGLMINEKVACARMMLDLENKDESVQRKALRKLKELCASKNTAKEKKAELIKAAEAAMYHGRESFAAEIKAMLEAMDDPAAEEAVKAVEGLDKVETVSMKELAVQKLHRRFSEERENRKLTLYLFYEKSGRPDAARAVMREK